MADPPERAGSSHESANAEMDGAPEAGDVKVALAAGADVVPPSEAESAQGEPHSEAAPPQDKGKQRAAADERADREAERPDVPSGERRPQLPAEKPFDFNRFLEQMKHRSALPVNEYVRSFFRGFTRRPYKPDEQVKLIFDFLDFIAARMAEAAVWAELPPGEFDQATEAMEKLVMNRLYTFTFSPAIAAEGHWPVQSDDLERDRMLTERIRLFAWVREEHLDVPRGAHSERFYRFAAQELNKINHYKAPRDKTICLLNCCKVIFGLIRHLDTEESADAFMPLLILVVLRANPANLVSNMEFIARFRTPQRRTSESEYYLSSLAGAVAFIERMDHTTLSHVTQEELEQRVQQAARQLEDEAVPPPDGRAPLSLSASMAAASLADDTRAFFQRTGEAARMGFSRLFTERPDQVAALPPAELQPMPPVTPAAPPARPPTLGIAPHAPRRTAFSSPSSDRAVPSPGTGAPASPSHDVAAARRAQQEDDSYEAVSEEQVAAATQTLQSIFPQADAAVLQMVLEECHLDVEQAIDRLLDMT
ncbi:Similar to S.cerevisiae protein VPS9 (Guanine nucleotide exchange factor (GEF)) [Malassezia sympodialis ATCC 42132]|uniref:Similar to S.cerevisiae protein VPS9 (Guanine nucleotide exchange factor (GEF)) n=1 Tax=Malassezia sympodialis (strain ATCC 42132) TaxID=1230383 RepID=A0A1M8A6H3_MALS4|nr:Similar to S.cerevisiae protein VPS9 (Guanine nucleotide exchange factor (GEF)) [Malassezia sympodialis ATCC 42132]